MVDLDKTKIDFSRKERERLADLCNVNYTTIWRWLRGDFKGSHNEELRWRMVEKVLQERKDRTDRIKDLLKLESV